MKVKMIKELRKQSHLLIRKNEVLEVRSFATVPFQFNPPYQVIEGPYSGEVIPREFCIELPKEKTYSEKEWNEMEKYYLKQLDKVRETQKVEIPQEVYDALERVRKTWKRYLNDDQYNSLMLNINAFGTTGDALILKEFAAKHPTEYIKALANGYKLKSTNINEEVYEIIDNWLNAEYVENEKKDIQLFAEKLTDYYKQNLSKTS